VGQLQQLPDSLYWYGPCSSQKATYVNVTEWLFNLDLLGAFSISKGKLWAEFIWLMTLPEGTQGPLLGELGGNRPSLSQTKADWLACDPMLPKTQYSPAEAKSLCDIAHNGRVSSLLDDQAYCCKGNQPLVVRSTSK
jgi:hypothetical protein